MTFEIQFNANPEIQHVNLRKEGAEHDILAVDVKIKGEAKGKCAAELLGCSDAEVQHLWHDDIEGHPARYSGITAIDSWAKFENSVCTIGKSKFEGVTAKKFKVKPIGGGNVEVVFQIGISDIPRDKVGVLGDLVGEHAKVEIRGEEDLFDDGEGEAA